jgi:hypothetical protein
VPTATPGEVKVLWTLPAAGTAQQVSRQALSACSFAGGPHRTTPRHLHASAQMLRCSHAPGALAIMMGAVVLLLLLQHCCAPSLCRLAGAYPANGCRRLALLSPRCFPMPLVLISSHLCILQAARTGFSVTARSKAPAIGVKYTEVGTYIADADAMSTVLALPGASPDAADWEFRVRSEVTGQQLSTPFPFAAVRPQSLHLPVY